LNGKADHLLGQSLGCGERRGAEFFENGLLVQRKRIVNSGADAAACQKVANGVAPGVNGNRKLVIHGSRVVSGEIQAVDAFE